jgi:hypothetical protein
MTEQACGNARSRRQRPAADGDHRGEESCVAAGDQEGGGQQDDGWPADKDQHGQARGKQAWLRMQGDQLIGGEGQARYLPKWAWVLICLIQNPLGGIMYLSIGHIGRPRPVPPGDAKP